MTDKNKHDDVFDLAMSAKCLMASLKYNPIEAMVDLAKNGELSPSKQLEAHKSLLPYFAPRFGTVGEEVKDSGNVYVQIASFDTEKINKKDFRGIASDIKSMQNYSDTKPSDIIDEK